MPLQTLDPTVKLHTLGTHRSRSPDETFKGLGSWLDRCGITRVANLTGLDRIGLPVVAVCRPNARSSAVFHGKGADLTAAKVSGLMEAIETWHAENTRLPLAFGSIDDVSSRLELIDVDALPHRSHARISQHTPLLWVEGRDLFSDRPLWLPFEMVHAHFTLDGPPSSGCFAMNTNGFASGNALWEAVSHGLCEVIERDATALWRASPAGWREKMRLDLSNVTDPPCLAVLDRFDAAGVDVAVWDIATDVGVPAYQCLINDRSAGGNHIGTGAGCHPAREIALLRALTEAAQVRMTYIVGSREDLLPSDYARATMIRRQQSATQTIGGMRGRRRFENSLSSEFRTFEDEVAWLIERLGGAGLRQTVMVDLSQAGSALSVVRVVVPGLEGSDHHPNDDVPGPRRRRLAEVRP